jgi:hypothetical protein
MKTLNDLSLLEFKPPTVKTAPAIKAGDSLWHRDSWGLWTRIVVDFVDGRFLVGMNDRNGFVRGLVSSFSKAIV